jgi:nitrate reductase NapE component
MKRCPACQRTYTDDTLRFCLEDGTTLLGSGASAPSDPLAATLIDSPPRDTSSNRSAPTELLRADSTFDRQSPQSPSWPPPSPSAPGGGRIQPQRYPPFVSSSAPESVEKRTWPAFAILATGIVTMLMLLGSFVGAGIKARSELIGFLFLAGMLLGIGGALAGAVVLVIAIRNPQRYGGKGIAIVGLLLNILPALFLALLIAIGIAVS